MSNVALVKAGCSEGDVYLDFLLTDYQGSSLLESVLKRLRAEIQDSENDDFRVLRLKVTSLGTHDVKTVS